MRARTLLQALVSSLALSVGGVGCVVYASSQPSTQKAAPPAPPPSSTSSSPQAPASTAQKPASTAMAKPALKPAATHVMRVSRVPLLVATPDGKMIEVDGKPVPLVTKAGPFGSGVAEEGALLGLIYFLTDDTPKLPNFDEYVPSGALYAKQLDVSPRDFTEGFPGVDSRHEWFALRYLGKFTVNASGDYEFRLVSDDGATLTIDNVPVIDNDGLHEPTEKRGKIRLLPGQHTIEVRYFQGPRPKVALQLFVTPPNGEEVLWSPSL